MHLQINLLNLIDKNTLSISEFKMRFFLRQKDNFGDIVSNLQPTTYYLLPTASTDGDTVHSLKS